jgi:hypothetical protein
LPFGVIESVSFEPFGECGDVPVEEEDVRPSLMSEGQFIPAAPGPADDRETAVVV